MRQFLLKLSASHRLKLVVISLAVVIYNNWLLGIWLNPNLFKKNGSVSEFSVQGQPHYLTFRVLDIISGILLISAAGLLTRELIDRRVGKFILISIAVLGLANVADALTALPCSETLSRNCVVPVHIAPAHFQVPAHAYSSVFIAVCYFLLPLSAAYLALQRRRWDMALSASFVIGVVIFSFGSAITNYFRSHSLTVHTAGNGQETQMIIFGIWLIIFGWQILRLSDRQTKTTESGRE